MHRNDNCALGFSCSLPVTFRNRIVTERGLTGGEYQHHSRIFLQSCESEEHAGQEYTARELSWAVSFLFKCSLIMDGEQLPPCVIWVQSVFSWPLLYFLMPSHHLLPSAACHFSLSAWEACILSFSYLCYIIHLSDKHE